MTHLDHDEASAIIIGSLEVYSGLMVGDIKTLDRLRGSLQGQTGGSGDGEVGELHCSRWLSVSARGDDRGVDGMS